MKKLMRRFRRDESGQALVLAALSVVVLLGMVALVIDVGFMQYQKRDLQNTADAAALAGVAYLNDFNDAKIDALVLDVIKANLGKDARISTSPSEIPNGDEVLVDVDKSQKNDGVLSVKLRTSSPKFFAGVLTKDGSTVGASATALMDGVSDLSKWASSALPFINMESGLHEVEGSTVFVKEKVNPGDFEMLYKAPGQSGQTGFRFNTSNLNYDIDFQHGTDFGLKISKGGGADSSEKSNLNVILKPGSIHYLFSIKPEFVALYLTGNNKNKDVVDMNHVRIYEVEFIKADHKDKDNGKYEFLIHNIYDLTSIGKEVNIIPNESVTQIKPRIRLVQ